MYTMYERLQRVAHALKYVICSSFVWHIILVSHGDRPWGEDELGLLWRIVDHRFMEVIGICLLLFAVMFIISYIADYMLWDSKE